MARQRSGLGGLCLPLTLQAAFFAAAAQMAAAAETHQTHLMTTPSDDAFVLAISAQAPIQALPAEDLLLQDLIMPPVEFASFEYTSPVEDYGPVAMPDAFIDFHHDDFFFV